MRKPIIAGNWKMHKTISESVSMVSDLKPQVSDVSDREIAVCPPFASLESAGKALKGSNIKLGAQNLFWEEKGAFTGEVSPAMLTDAGCSYVIIGHSERRQYFGETDDTVNKKIFAALKVKLTPIVCIGESLEQREKALVIHGRTHHCQQPHDGPSRLGAHIQRPLPTLQGYARTRSPIPERL